MTMIEYIELVHAIIHDLAELFGIVLAHCEKVHRK